MSTTILALFCVVVVGLVTFLRVEVRSASPVLALGLFRNRHFTVPILCLVLNFAGQSAVTFLMPFYLMKVQGLGSAHAGLIIATVPAMMLVLSPISGRAADRLGLRHQPTLGLALVCAGLALLATLGLDTPTPLIVARLALVGTGAAIFQSPNSAAIMSSVPRTMLGTASAAVATSRNIGNAAGLALASTLLVTVGGTVAGVRVARVEIPPAQLLDGVRTAFAVAAVCSSFAIAASIFRPRRADPTSVVITDEPSAGAR